MGCRLIGSEGPTNRDPQSYAAPQGQTVYTQRGSPTPGSPSTPGYPGNNGGMAFIQPGNNQGYGPPGNMGQATNNQGYVEMGGKQL